METNDEAGLSRRDLFRVGAGAATAAVGSSVATPAYAQETFEYDGWFEDANNFDGTVDMTGEEEVIVEVGAGEVGLAFDPAAIHVDPGTTVVWEWTGEGGGHNVAERETGERYESERTDEAGTRYDVTVESDGISKYVCVPHAASGMKGAIAVGSGDGVPEITEGETVTEPDGGGESGGDGESGDDSNGESDEETPPALKADDSVFALFGLSAVVALFSPLAVVFLMRRNGEKEHEADQ
jgi:halocyanin-like protein